jgi:PAS domain-containing protein
MVREFPGFVVAVSVDDAAVVAMSAELEQALDPADPATHLADFVTDEVSAALERSVAERTTVRVPGVTVDLPTGQRYVDLTIRPLLHADGPRALLVRLDDCTDLVTSRDAADDARADAEGARADYECAEVRHRELFELMTHGVVYHGLDLVVADANTAALEILGADTLEELRQREAADPVWRSVTPDGRPMPTDELPVVRTLGTGVTTGPIVVGVDRVDAPERRWLRVTSNPRYGRTGELIGVFTLFEDISEQVRLEAIAADLERERFGTRLRLAMEAMHDSVVIGSPIVEDGSVVDLRVEYFTGKLAGTEAAELVGLVGRRFSEAWPELLGNGLLERFVEVLGTGMSARFEEIDFAATHDRRPQTVDISVAEVDGQVVVVWRDVTDRVARERQLREAERLARLARWRLDDGGGLRISSAGPRVLGEGDALAATRQLRPLVDDLIADHGDGEDSAEFRVVPTAGAARDIIVTVRRLGPGWSGTVQDVTPTRRVERALAFERQTVELLQQAVIPDVIEPIAGFDLGACYESASGEHLVGGDWFDVVVLEGERRFAVIVGDVAGHGVAAAQHMLQLRHWSRLLCIESDSPAQLLRRLNTSTHQFLSGQMATALVAFVHPDAGDMVWATAGHPPLAVVRDGAAELLRHNSVGYPIGIDNRWEGRDQLDALDGLEALVAYTDGLVERRHESLSVGFERLMSALGNTRQRSAQHWCDHLMKTLRRDTEAIDDACVVIVRRDDGSNWAGSN